MPILHNPKGYRSRSTPIPREQAAENIESFYKEFIDLMEKYHIADANVVLEVCVVVPARDLTEEDDEALVTSVAHIGDQMKAVPMAAYGHAFLRAESDALIDRRKASGAKHGADRR